MDFWMWPVAVPTLVVGEDELILVKCTPLVR